MIKSTLIETGKNVLVTAVTAGAIIYYQNSGIRGNMRRLGRKVRNKVRSIKE